MPPTSWCHQHHDQHQIVFRVVTQTDFWKTNPCLIKTRKRYITSRTHAPKSIKYFLSPKPSVMDEFSRNGSGSFPKFLNSKRVSKKSVSWRQESGSWRRMLETKYVGDINDIGDGFGHFGHQYPISFYISVEHQHSKDVTNSEILSRKLKNRQKL